MRHKVAMAKVVFILLCGLLAAVQAPDNAQANGAYSHVHISQLAVALLPQGPLRALLSDPANINAYEAGSMFPDSGYAVDDDYGEQAHWAPFQEAYLEHLKALYAGDYTSPEAAAKVAFLMGMASHGLADQTYDTTLLARSFEVDGDQSGDVDRLADYFIVVDQNISIAVEAWAPYQEISDVFLAQAGYTVAVNTLERGMTTMEGVMGVQRRAARSEYLNTWQLHPWLGTHIYNPQAPGSLPHLGQLVAAYWEVLWRRLHGQASMDTDLLVGSIPIDGGENFPTDASESVVYSRVGVVFGYGLRRSQVSDKIKLLDDQGALVQTRLVTPYNGEIRNFMMLEPVSGLAFNTLYTVEVAPGVENLQGEVSTVAYRFSFRTRCAPDALNDCPPLPPPLVTGPIPTEVPPLPTAEDTSPPDTDTTPEDTNPDLTSEEDTASAPDTAPDPAPEPDTEPATTPAPDTQNPQPTTQNTSDCSCALTRRGPQKGTLPWVFVALIGAAGVARSRRGKNPDKAN